ncbi:HIT family protein [Spiroplasma endosymbiont of Labia minor]|uniref:HIT family protein n=1 Tax=Spiroplasma endosymbiont of Labia minor TaxID=3066305 RepID=UPI0030CB39A0
MPNKEDCIFCKIVKGDIGSRKIYEDEKTLAFLDVMPNADGHTLVIPKKHFENLTDCDNDYLQAVINTKKIVAKMLLTKLKPSGINYVSNQGSIAYQVVFHYHEHIIPKYVENEGYILSKVVDKTKWTNDNFDNVLNKIIK